MTLMPKMYQRVNKLLAATHVHTRARAHTDTKVRYRLAFALQRVARSLTSQLSIFEGAQFPRRNVTSRTQSNAVRLKTAGALRTLVSNDAHAVGPPGSPTKKQVRYVLLGGPRKDAAGKTRTSFFVWRCGHLHGNRPHATQVTPNNRLTALPGNTNNTAWAL
jgi:hypothetical protein